MSHTTGGIASVTRTRVDSAAKHIMPGKIDTNLMKIYSGNANADLQTLHQKKLDLLTNKDDLILNVSRKLEGLDARTFHAYPAVISTLGKCSGDTACTHKEDNKAMQIEMPKMPMVEQAHNYATKKTRVIKVAEAAITTTTKTYGLVHLAQRPQEQRE
jgi:hypothetical protein